MTKKRIVYERKSPFQEALKKQRRLSNMITLLSSAYLKSCENNWNVTLLYLNSILGWPGNNISDIMRNSPANKLFKEHIGEDGIYYTLNAKYRQIQQPYMVDYIKIIAKRGF